MASDQSFAQYVADQIGLPGRGAFRKMFGEYAIYLDGKVVALVCDNQCFFKPTAPGRSLLGEPVERPPYPGAKPHFLITEQLEDQDLVSRLAQATASALPAPKATKRRPPASRR
jgi:TfoX/Sxy family transcriptional regulator of competence genes